ncbi:hypothetical protein B0T16DRAFT_316009 [Cercophora newfieldiana]|uniref:Uncharacterized protein n=1 Tax=Cercophora newfieldiana TaxID=92897 RepID=A0AA40CZZ3_9PEZI|nr:hypothetical protein B0T16DRAFT_316009 [Cercophora newfieldiana]
MRFITLGFLASALFATAAPADSTLLPRGYDLVPMAFELEVSLGRVEVFNGTVQEAIAQAQALNPDFQLPELSLPEQEPLNAPERRELQRRVQVKFCYNWDGAERAAIYQGIYYLRSLSGTPTLGPGPGKCARVSCSYNSAIIWCNDNTVSKTITWDGMANSAKRITEICGWGLNPYNNRYYTSGQNFEDSNWNTLIKKESC